MALRHRGSPTLSPQRKATAYQHHLDSAGPTTRHRLQHHHAPTRSPNCQTASKISDWTVATLQRALKDRGIPFHRTDNKAKPFNSLMSASHSSSVHTCTLPDDVTMPTPSMHRNASTSLKGPACHQLFPQKQQKEMQRKQGWSLLSKKRDSRKAVSPQHSHQPQQPASPRASSTRASATMAASFQSHQTSPWDHDTGMSAPSTFFIHQVEQLTHATASGTGLPAPPSALPQHPQQFSFVRASGTGMPVPPTVHPQQL